MSSFYQTRIKPLDELEPKLNKQDSEIVINMGFQEKIRESNMYPKAKPSAFVRQNSIFVSKPVKSRKVTEMYSNMLRSIDGEEKKSLKNIKKVIGKTASKSNNRKPL